MKSIWIDEKRGHKLTDIDLLTRISSCDKVPRYIRTADPQEMMVQLLSGMVYGQEMVLLDADFSLQEISAMGMDTEKLTDMTAVSPQHLSEMGSVTEAIATQPWKLWMFTSGTTGLPKKVCHSYKTLGRNVRVSERHHDDIWAFAYRFSHMAGVQVLLQAIMNENTMVYVFEDEPRSIVGNLAKFSCTHISATPTFYRNILQYVGKDKLCLHHLTLGGEKYDADLCEKLKSLLPDVKMHNIYASTETGSILNAVGDAFTIPEKYKDKVRISADGELLIHQSLLGEFPLEGEWYNTHDIVVVDNGLLKFQSRKSDLLNIGGYKVNPLEVEGAMQEVTGVKDCLVYGQKNSVLGTILLADIVLEVGFTEKDVKKSVRRELKDKLQNFKIPRVFQFVTEIARTRSGKKVRK